MLSAYAQTRGLTVTVLLLDLRKFFEYVWRRQFVAEVWATGVNVKLLRALRCMYEGWRAVATKGTAGEPFAIVGSILAGCSCAMSPAKLKVYRLLKAVDSRYPVLRLGNLADDITGQAVATLRLAVDQTAGGARDLVEGLKQLRLPLNVSKTAVLASSVEERIARAERAALGAMAGVAADSGTDDDEGTDGGG